MASSALLGARPASRNDANSVLMNRRPRRRMRGHDRRLALRAGFRRRTATTRSSPSRAVLGHAASARRDRVEPFAKANPDVLAVVTRTAITPFAGRRRATSGRARWHWPRRLEGRSECPPGPAQLRGRWADSGRRLQGVVSACAPPTLPHARLCRRLPMDQDLDRALCPRAGYEQTCDAL